MDKNPEVATLYATLARYRELLRLNSDKMLRAALHVSIQETEEKLAALKRAADKPLHHD